MAKEKQLSTFRRFLNLLFNVFWIITCGLVNAVMCILSGVLSCILIIPIFIGIPKVYFKVAGLAFAPAGKHVNLHFAKAPIRNILYWIFLGFLNAIGTFVYGAVLCCTIIFIPIGIQEFKFGKYYLAPFGAEIYKDGKK